MRTKEEILDKHIGEIRASRQAEIWYDDAIKAMEEYAQEVAKNAVLDLSNLMFQKMQEVSKEHFDESRLDSWDSDEAFGQYTAYSDCRSRLFAIYRKFAMQEHSS